MSSIGAAPRAAVSLSPARAAASRRNGAKSCGPKTPEGKARSAQNALKHGLRAQKHLVLPDEDRAAFAALEAALMAELAPEGALQAVLARRIVAAAWRLERAERLEAELFEKQGAPVLGRHGPGIALIRDGNGPRAFETLLRYRGTATAELWRALRTLKALQYERAEANRMPTPSPEPVLPEPRQLPIRPEGRGTPGELASQPAVRESAPGPAAAVTVAAPSDRAARAGPDEPKSCGNPGYSSRPGRPAAPRLAEPSPSMPAGIAGRDGASLLAGTALVPPGRRRWA